MSTTPTQSPSSLIEKRVDKDITSELGLGKSGSLNFANVTQIMEVAKLMAISQIAIPGHLRDNPGACLAVAIQASEWQMSPFAVANKSYSVNNRLAYEAQLVAAVILKRAPIVGRIKYHYTGEGGKRKCTTSATLADDGEVVEYTSPEFDKIPVKNSPLWKADPDQQLGYYSVRAMCRRHFPDVILGIYTPEEMDAATHQEPEREVTPSKPSFLNRSQGQGRSKAEPETIPLSATPEPEPEQTQAPAETPAPKDAANPADQMAHWLNANEIDESEYVAWLVKQKLAKANQTFSDLAMSKHEYALQNLDEILKAAKPQS